MDIHAKISDINFNTSCVKCEDVPGSCGTLPIKSEWSVHRDHYGTCNEGLQLTVAVHIPRVTKEDKGKLVLAWSSDSQGQSPQSHAQLTQTVVQVTEKQQAQSGGHSVYIYVGIVCGIVFAAVAVIAVVLVIRVVVRKKKRPPTLLPTRQGKSIIIICYNYDTPIWHAIY